MIEQGHQLYTVSPSSGDEAELEIHDGRLRTKPNPNIDTNLANLPDCSPR